VLVGRGAQAVLATRPNALHVYVIASKPFRKKVAVERLEWTRQPSTKCSTRPTNSAMST